MGAKKTVSDTDRIDAIIAVLAANGISLPEALGGDSATSDETAIEPEAAPADAS